MTEERRRAPRCARRRRLGDGSRRRRPYDAGGATREPHALPAAAGSTAYCARALAQTCGGWRRGHEALAATGGSTIRTGSGGRRAD
eukprot:2716625-Pleurochrysis_carterae.AAC.1